MEIKQRLLIILIIAFVFLSGCGGEKAEIKYFDVDNFEILSAKGYWDEASGLAVNWQKDAYLTNASVEIPLPNANRGVKAGTLFRFQALGNDTSFLLVNCSKNMCDKKESKRNPEFPVTHSKPITKSDFDISSANAFEIGVREGGIEYIYNENSEAFLILIRDNPDNSGRVIWVVNFIQFRTGDFPEELMVEIDANTGEVLETNQ